MFESGSDQSVTVQHAIAAIDRGDTLHGLIALECAPRLREIPVVNSYLAYCIAKERGACREALQMCQAALSAEPRNPAHHLNLGRVYLLANRKAHAITAFRKGLSIDPANDEHASAQSPRESQTRQRALILEELRRMGIRRRPPFPSLDRAHPVNRIAGRVLTALRVRY